MPHNPASVLAVVIPALNERENLAGLLPVLSEVLSSIDAETAVYVVDGGSKDGTAEAAQTLGATVVHQTERGYGGALIAGFHAARDASYVVTMDADLSHPPVFIQEFWRLREQADVMIASRFVAGGKADMSRFRWILSRILNFIFPRLLGIPVHDMSSGYRMYRSPMIASLELRSRDFNVLQEILVKVFLRHARIHEVPFHYMPRGSGESHARLIRFGKAYLRTLWRTVRLRYFNRPF